MKYILAIDQSTQGTKVLLVDENGIIVVQNSIAHRQIVDSNGYVSHNPEEIYSNIVLLAKSTVECVDRSDVVAIGISNQRETTVLFDKNGSLAPAVVWQCNRSKEITDNLAAWSDTVYAKTGLPLSPYFPAGKMRWLISHCNPHGNYMLGTVDSYLVYRMTGNFYTDASNASRTQLYNLETLDWDKDLLKIFGIKIECLPQVMHSDACFGYTTLDGIFEKPLPITAVMGDSHAALYAHGCVNDGDTKVTYGTGSSVMMNTGNKRICSQYGLSSSVAWNIGGEVNYVLEGNINYSAAVISWLNELGIIDSPAISSYMAQNANPEDTTVMVPAFSGLSAPYWKSNAKAAITGMTRTTGKNEIVRAALDAIAFQVNDVLLAISSDSHRTLRTVFADGGATANEYLMQTQSNISDMRVEVPVGREYSALGAAMLAGKNFGFKFLNDMSTVYNRNISQENRLKKLSLWETAVLNIK